MKYLKYIIVGLAVFLSLPFIAGFFVENTYAVEEEILINENKQSVFEHLKLLKNHEDFGLWVSKTAKTEFIYTGTDGAEGFLANWISKDELIGKGSQEIVAINNSDSIAYIVRFDKADSGGEKMYIRTEAESANTTKVYWGFESSIPYPMNALLLVVNFEETIATDLKAALKRLKLKLEAR